MNLSQLFGGGVAVIHEKQPLTDAERRRFLKILGVGGGVAATGFTLEDVRTALEGETTDELAAIGEAIRNDLTGRLDREFLSTQLTHIEERFEALATLTAGGLPDERGTAYQELTAPAWNVHDHLAEVGFYESAETHLPRFAPAHIRSSARQLIRTGPLTQGLSEVGFSEQEKVALVMNVVDNDERLAQWVPTKDIPEERVEFDPERVAPLQERAAAGSLLWIDDLDRHLWQSEVLITDETFEQGMWHVKAMLGGFHLLSASIHDLGGPADLSDSQLTAALTSSTAAMIVSQENIARDLFRITDEMRAPRGGA